MQHPVVARAFKLAELGKSDDMQDECDRLLKALNTATTEHTSAFERKTGRTGRIPTFKAKTEKSSKTVEMWRIAPTAQTGGVITRATQHPAFKESGAVPQFDLWNKWRG